MKTTALNLSASSSGNRSYPLKIVIAVLSLFFFGIQTPAIAQSAAASNSLAGWFLPTVIGLMGILILWVLTVIRKALVVLKENGQSVNLFSFRVFRAMSYNSGLVTAMVVLIVLVGIYYAVNY
jgi:hypothetical protein